MAKHIASCSSMLSFKGSPYWMAPEVVMNTNGYSLPVDIWSLGCTVLEMATSKPPWSQFEGVAAIFKIGNSKDIPEIPEHLSADAKSFIRLCLQREPSARPTAAQLLTHPFTALEMHSSRMHSSSSDRDDASRLTVPRTLISPRDNTRTITSLPTPHENHPIVPPKGAKKFPTPRTPVVSTTARPEESINHSSCKHSRVLDRLLHAWIRLRQSKSGIGLHRSDHKVKEYCVESNGFIVSVPYYVVMAEDGCSRD
ncbi:UNVERIFIED_CONTAM: Mitogen-activated protein kinase kinase kinase [Sesamum radiatum]|uniref:Mitogen-activated protein kinase kinase kinase n=1 Tax=Sesamum radiatum TaxID=300843 RepID=A0AAW2REB9_SESRA